MPFSHPNRLPGREHCTHPSSRSQDSAPAGLTGVSVWRAVGHMLAVYALGPIAGESDADHRLRAGRSRWSHCCPAELFRIPGHRHCPRQAARSRARLGADAFHPASHEDGEVCRLRRSRGNLLRGRRCRPFDDEGSGHGRRAAAAQGRGSAGAADILLSKRGCQRTARASLLRKCLRRNGHAACRLRHARRGRGLFYAHDRRLRHRPLSLGKRRGSREFVPDSQRHPASSRSRETMS